MSPIRLSHIIFKESCHLAVKGYRNWAYSIQELPQKEHQDQGQFEPIIDCMFSYTVTNKPLIWLSSPCSPYAVCHSNNNNNIPLSTVVVTCSVLPIPTNGRRSSSQRNYNVTVSFSCNTGYNLRGNSSRTCQSTGQWSGTQPTCDSKLLCPARVWLQRMNDINCSHVMLFPIPSQSENVIFFFNVRILWYSKILSKWRGKLHQHYCWEHCHLHL